MVFLYTVDRHILLDLQTCQHHAQAHIALLEVGNRSHDLLVSGVVAGLVDLLSQLSQFSGMGSVVGDHVLHQSGQLFHGGMLTAALTAMAMAAAVMGVVVGVIVAMAVLVQMLVLMGMDMIVGMCVIMRMGMGNTVVGVLVGMGVIMFMVVAAAGDVIVMNMHIVSPLCFSFIIPAVRDSVKTFIFAEISPLWACATVEKGV